MNDIVYQHEVIVPDRGLPFKLFLFEGGGGKYIREKHWHRSIELFAGLLYGRTVYLVFPQRKRG